MLFKYKSERASFVKEEYAEGESSMGSELYFYKVEKIREKIPSIVDRNKYENLYTIVPESSVSLWEKQFCIRRKTVYDVTDYFKAAEDKFNVKPSSMQFPSNYGRNDPDEEYRFYKGDDYLGSLIKKEFEPYRRKEEGIVYLYKRTLISNAEWYSCLNIQRDNGIVDERYIMSLLRNAVSDIGEEPTGYEGQAIVAVLKALFAVKDGDTIAMVRE